MRADFKLEQAGRRLLRFLSKGPASVRSSANFGSVLIEAAERRTISLDSEILELLASQGIIVKEANSVALTPAGAALAQQMAFNDKGGQNHCEIGLAKIDTGNGSRIVLADLSESPLAQLVRRKTKSGVPFLTASEFDAGERLRSEYTRGQIMPRLGASWESSGASGSKSGSGGAAELTEAALGARLRVENAIVAVGPELSGVLIDVCCFLKGLERVEAERGWPIRSAKIVLKSALGVLARHYNPEQKMRNTSNRKTLHWGAQGYRPTIAG